MSTEEKINQAKGTVKEGFGKLTGDKKTEKEGAAEKVVSKVKEVAEAKDGKTKLRKVAVNIPQKLAEWGVEMEKMMKYTGGTYDL